ncbi:MAG: hypothetical protein RR253_06100 [Oscillospiraceae bacterium]
MYKEYQITIKDIIIFAIFIILTAVGTYRGNKKPQDVQNDVNLNYGLSQIEYISVNEDNHKANISIVYGG